MLKYIQADCGSGKTHSLIEMTKRSNEKFIIVQSTLQLIDQTSKGLSNICTVITSSEHSNVINSTMEFLMNPTSRVLVLSEKAFLGISDISLLKNWKIYLDDVVNFHAYNIINTEKKYEVENELFRDFEEVSSQYLTAKPVLEFSDDLLNHMSNLFDFVGTYDHFVMNRNFFDKIGKAGNVDVYSNDCKQLTTLAWVNISKYKDLDVTFMSNLFEETLIYKGNKELFDKVDLEGLRERVKPVRERLKVYYFSENHRLTKSFRDSHGEKLQEVYDYINANVKQPYYYTTNTRTGKVLNGVHIKPVSRGMNSFQDYSTCVWLASMKPSPVEAKQLELMFKITGEEITYARELENLYQFCNRSSLRKYDSTEQVVVYVFDKEQAQFLSDNIEYIDVGIDKEVVKFVPAKLSDADYKRLGKVTIKRFPDQESFDRWMNSTVNSHLNDLQRDKFYQKYNRVRG
ncbi:type III restriction endonuclease subunit R [Serratia proteamaculans]|uniref:type III restriction endonuclease subunit R n=1 Tax=Serratia proteamaculans TaxID=28151 RepID=UPI0010765117|nr:type III restriction endonuclease subunit R [Serratia proteamaculans]TFZ49716.1 type III restriction endonuclease subunit R [Serratia proteamaculans]